MSRVVDHSWLFFLICIVAAFGWTVLMWLLVIYLVLVILEWAYKKFLSKKIESVLSKIRLKRKYTKNLLILDKRVSSVDSSKVRSDLDKISREVELLEEGLKNVENHLRDLDKKRHNQSSKYL